LNLERT